MTITPFLIFFFLIFIIWFIKENSLKRILQAIFTLTIIIILFIVSSWGNYHLAMYKGLNDPKYIMSCHPDWCHSPILCPIPRECKGCDESQ